MNYEKYSVFSNSQEDLDVLTRQSMLGCQRQECTSHANMPTNDSLLLVMAGGKL
jgi:hypothetical protein